MTTFEEHRDAALQKGWTNLWADLPLDGDFVMLLAKLDDLEAPVMKISYTAEGHVDFGDLYNNELRVWLDTIDPTTSAEVREHQVRGWITNPPTEQTKVAKRIISRVPREQYEMLMLSNYMTLVTIQEARRDAKGG